MPDFSKCEPTEPAAPSPRRWIIAGLLLAASVLNYVDRQSLALLAPTIQKELHLSDAGYATVLNLFLAAYTVSYVVSGRIVDKIGVRVGLALFLGWWSLSNLLTGLARSATGLGVAQASLGLGEAGNWTAGPKAVAEWFPERERALALGACTLGATLGATLAPIIVIGLSDRFGWSAAFLVTGAAGLLWILPWLWLYRRPATPAAVAQKPRSPSWASVLRRPEVWRLTLARLLTDPVWFFLQFWFAKYLHEERHVSQSALSITWIVYLAADVGTLSGGWLSGRLIRGERTPAASRLAVMAVAAFLVPLVAAIPSAPVLWLVLGLAMIAVGAHLSWLVNLTALVVDVVPKEAVGTAFGVIAAGSTAGGIAMNWLVGHLVTHFSYGPAFVALAFLHPLALGILWRMRRR